MVIFLSSLALHIALALKIYFHQKKEETQVQAQIAPALSAANMTLVKQCFKRWLDDLELYHFLLPQPSLITLQTSVGVVLFFYHQPFGSYLCH